MPPAVMPGAPPLAKHPAMAQSRHTTPPTVRCPLLLSRIEPLLVEVVCIDFQGRPHQRCRTGQACVHDRFQCARATRSDGLPLVVEKRVVSARPKVFWYTTFLCNSQTIRYVKSISRSMIVRYVRPLTEQQRALLESTMKNDASHRARMRAHGLLLSSEGITIKAIAKIYHVDRDTVATWIKKWEKYGAKSLHDQPRSGRPTTLNATEKELAKQYIKEDPRSLKHVAERLAQKTAKRLSISSLKRLAKKARLRWKRVRKSSKSLRDPLDFAKCKRELEA